MSAACYELRSIHPRKMMLGLCLEFRLRSLAPSLISVTKKAPPFTCGLKANPNSKPLSALSWELFQESLEEILVWQQMWTGEREQDERTRHASAGVYWGRGGGKESGSEETARVLPKSLAS